MTRISKTLFLLLLGQVALSQSLLDEGIGFLEAGAFDKATVVLLEFIEEQPEDKTGRICYGRAIGLAGHTEEALGIFRGMALEFPGDTEILLNLAECHLWHRTPEPALSIYNKLIIEQPHNFTVLLGMGNAYAARQDYQRSLDYINRALDIEPDNSLAENSRKSVSTALAYVLYKRGSYLDAKNILQDLLSLYPHDAEASKILSLIRSESRTTLNTIYQIQSDNGLNANVTRSIGFDFRLNGRHKLGMSFGDNTYRSGTNSRKATSQFMSISDKITVSSKTQLNLNYRVSNNRSGDNQYTLSTYLAGIERFWNNRIYSKLQYSRENQDYNVDLLESQITMDHYSLANNINLTDWLGWYSEMVYTDQSDQNARQLLFTSLYFMVSKNPDIRVGYNFNYIAFDRKRPQYFSPDSFRANEFFVLMSNEASANKIGYHILFAVGQQQVEDAGQQISSRVDARAHWKVTKRIQVGAIYLFNNAASATALGDFSSQTIGMNLNVQLN